MSEFVLLFRSDEAGYRAAMSTPELAQRSMQAWLSWIRDLEAKGHLKDPGQPLDRTGKVIDGKNDKKVVTDGPYAETKDMVYGFIVLEATDMAQAVELAGRCPMVEGGGSVEIRPVMKTPM